MHVTVIGDLVVDVCSHCSFVTHSKVTGVICSSGYLDTAFSSNISAWHFT